MNVQQLKKFIITEIKKGVEMELKKSMSKIRTSIINEISENLQTIITEGLSDIVSNQYSVKLIPTKQSILENEEYIPEEPVRRQSYSEREKIPQKPLKFKDSGLNKLFEDMKPFSKKEEMGMASYGQDEENSAPLFDNRNSEGAPLDYSKIDGSLIEAVTQDFRPMMKRLNEIDYRKKGGNKTFSSIGNNMINQKW